MMYGVFGFGWLMMLVIVGLPLLLIVLVIAAAQGGLGNLGSNRLVNQSQLPVNYPPVSYSEPAQKADRYCSHCGTGLKAVWTHCPQCGAPVE